MTLNSVVFILFFAIVFLLYFTICRKHQRALLLIASAVFLLNYQVQSLILLLSVSLLVWICALACERQKKGRKLIVVVCNLLLLGILFVYKYLNFSINVLSFLKVKLFHTGSVISEPVFHLLLPVGISFWIFQNIAYLVDVYKSKIPAEKSLGRYLLFIGYYSILASNKKDAQRLISYCYEKNYIPVFICLPVTKNLTDRFSEDFMKEFDENNAWLCGQYKDLVFLDYSRDERFCTHLEWFKDSDHLNSIGGDLFTQQVLDDLVTEGILDKDMVVD